MSDAGTTAFLDPKTFKSNLYTFSNFSDLSRLLPGGLCFIRHVKPQSPPSLVDPRIYFLDMDYASNIFISYYIAPFKKINYVQHNINT